MKPQRMCMVCRERTEKDRLIRIVKNKNGSICIDQTGKLEGRGAYLCKGKDCIRRAQKRKALERAFSCKVEEAVYEELQAIAEV